MKTAIKFPVLILGLLFLVFGVTSCDKFNEPIDTTRNEIDDLRIAYTNLKYFSATRTYTYTCTSDLNELRFAGPITSGIIELEIIDQDGNVVLDQTYSNISTERPTFTNGAGEWTVKLKMTNVSGMLTVRLNKKL